MNQTRFNQQLAFILEADKEKNILRQTHLSGYIRRENDAEHAWHMALMIYLLKEYSNEKIDVAKAMMPASGSSQMSQLFASDGQSTGVSASTSVLPMNTQD